MKNIEFNLATTPFIQSLSKYEEYFTHYTYSNPDDLNQKFDTNDIINLTKDFLTVAEIDFEDVSIEKTEKKENGLSDCVRVTIICLGKAWTTYDMNFNENSFSFFENDSYKLYYLINSILYKKASPKRFFLIANQFWGEDGDLYAYSSKIAFANIEFMKKVLHKLKIGDYATDLLNSKRTFYVNKYFDFSLISEKEDERLIATRFSPINPNDTFEKNIVLNVETFTLNDFDESLKRSDIEPFYLWIEDKQNYNFICDTLAKYLTNKTVDITQNDRNTTIYFEDKESLTIPRFIKKENNNLPNTIGIVESLNSLLQFYNSTKRIYFYCLDYRAKEHANSYFICDLEVGNQIFELIKKKHGLIGDNFYRPDVHLNLYLVYENEEIKVGINNEPIKKLLGVDVPSGQKWEDLLVHFLLLDDHRKMPNSAWNKKSKQLIEDIGEDEFINLGVTWISRCIENATINHRNIQLGLAHEVITESLIGKIHPNQGHPKWLVDVYGDKIKAGSFFITKAQVMNNSSNYFYYSLGGRILRGFLHCATLVNKKDILFLVDRFAVTNPNECADVIHVYTQLPPNEGVPRLTRLRSKIKKKNIQTRIETALKKIGEKLNLTPDQVEEFSLSDYDLNKNHELISDLGDFKAIFKIDTYKKTSLNWIDSKGKIQVSIPAKVKNEYANDLKELKAAIKEIEAQLPIQKDRIEGFYLKNRSWTYNEWLPLYINHSLMGVIGKQLIWHFYDETHKNQGIWKDGQFVDVNENPIDWLNEKTQVQLWHPIGFNADYILSWRTYLQKNEITQPFKQAFREVYILTDAELNTHSYSNRFAGHILNREHFGALCKARNWTPNAMASGMPTKRVAAWNIMVEYWVNEVWLGQHSSFYGSAHLTTDQVRFYRNKQQINMDDVPAIIFSELMRDIDLFVGVTSIANDPNWQDRGDNNTRNYWVNYAFGDLSESSKIREQALKNFIPKLKIASKCSFEGKFLKVQGKIRNYKIHLGSGNILMEPNDQYLCIVPDASKNNYTNKLYLPFEGDNMLSIIVSKATLLADDDKITDETILRQIKI